jgi:hypothetical protein
VQQTMAGKAEQSPSGSGKSFIQDATSSPASQRQQQQLCELPPQAVAYHRGTRGSPEEQLDLVEGCMPTPGGDGVKGGAKLPAATLGNPRVDFLFLLCVAVCGVVAPSFIIISILNNSTLC